MPAQSRDAAEAALVVVVSKSTRTYLQRVLDAVLEAIKAGRYDDAQPVLALGVLLNWWTDSVGEDVVESIRESWQAAFGVTAQGVTTPRADAMAFHIAAVRDRLSRSSLPEIPEAAFDQVRLSQSAAALGGWDIPTQSRDIAERLAWEPDKTYWKQQRRLAEDEIDKILDPLGPPGTPARTYAHQNDPAVKVWQSVRASAIDKIREQEGDWKVRATRIARTEATAAWNSGSLAALADEGMTHKEWLATTDHRTRDSHRLADGQVVPMTKPFKVGQSLLMMPGDPAGPPWETINCRCTVIGADAPEQRALTAAGTPGVDQARVPKGNGRISGRWLDMPGALLQDLIPEVPMYVSQMRPASDQDKADFKAKHGKSIPPSWTDVEVDLNDEASLVARGKDKQGRTVRLYSQAHHDRQAARKFERLKEVHASLPKIEKALKKIDGDPVRAVARLMYTEGIRVGSTDEQLGKVKAFGAATLQARHAKVNDDGSVHLSFVAKEGIPVGYDIKDPELVKYITARLAENPKPDEPLFPGASADKTMRLLRESSGLPNIKNHDLRTLLANRLALIALQDMTPPPPESPKEMAKLRKQVGEFVAAQLRNKPTQALASYINPAVFAAIRDTQTFAITPEQDAAFAEFLATTEYVEDPVGEDIDPDQTLAAVAERLSGVTPWDDGFEETVQEALQAVAVAQSDDPMNETLADAREALEALLLVNWGLPPDNDTLLAAGFDADQLRIPKGNGKLSGRWMDSPMQILDRLDQAGFLMNGEANVHLRGARNAAENFNPTSEPNISEILSDLEYARQLEVQQSGEWTMTQALDKAIADLEVLNEVDWSLFEESTDIRGTALDPQVTDIGTGLVVGASGNLHRKPQVIFDELQREMGEFPESSRAEASYREIQVLLDDMEGRTPGNFDYETLADEFEYAAQNAMGDSNIDAPTREQMYNRIMKAAQEVRDIADSDYVSQDERTAQQIHDLLDPISYDQRIEETPDTDLMSPLADLDPSDEADQAEIIRLTQDTLRNMLALEEGPSEREVKELQLAMTARINKILTDSGIDMYVEPKNGVANYLGVEMGWQFIDGTDSQPVGSLTRRIDLDLATVTNDYFQLRTDKQNGGVGAALTVGLEAWYADSGISEIKVHADIDVGGYTWAKMGFEIDDDEADPSNTIGGVLTKLIDNVARQNDSPIMRLWSQRTVNPMDSYASSIDLSESDIRHMVDELNEMGADTIGYSVDEELVANWIERADTYESDDVINEIIEEYKSLLEPSSVWLTHMDLLEEWASSYDSGEAPSMYEIATYGQGTSLQTTTEKRIYDTDRTQTIATWPGKQALLGSDWYGKKYLG